MLKTLEGIVLRARNYGDNDKIITVFSKTEGLFSFFAKGSRKIRSRFLNVLEPFTRAYFLYFKKKGLASLNQVDVIYTYNKLRKDLILTSYASYWLEIVEKIQEYKIANQAFYNFILAALHKLEEGTDPEILTLIVELKFIEQAGYKPVFKQCISCNCLENLVSFAILQGGFLCRNCEEKFKKRFKETNFIIPLAAKSVYIFKVLQHINIANLGKVFLSQKTKEQLKESLQTFISQHLQFKSKAKKVLNELVKLEC